MMNLQQESAGRRRGWLRPNPGCGDAAIAWASAAPLIVLALAVAADHVRVLRFKTQVRLAADAASLAAAGAIARHPDGAGDRVANRVAAVVFASKPRAAL
jgi:hypothetical protein